jgi:hypothetical protein
MGKFEEVYAINVNGKTEKKGSLTYLSWAFAWAEFKKIYPDATYEIQHFDGTYCTGNEKIGYMVNTKVTAGEQTYEMWLPVMDSRNQSILFPKMTEINKSIMRCLTKNLAMFGLGLYIYAGEDLPEDNKSEDEGEIEKVKPIKTPQNKPKTEPKTNDNAKSFVPLTKDEILRKYGVKQVEETIVWFEGRFGVEFANWGEAETEMARLKLQEKKEKREAEEKKKRELARIDESDLPFSMGD